MEADDLGGEYWYVPETLARYNEIEEAVAASCAKSRTYEACTSNKRVMYLVNGGKREQAVWSLKNQYFVITAINPMRSTMRVYYTGLDTAAASGRSNISELYLYWLEDDKITPQLSYTMANFYTEKIKNSQYEKGLHVILAKNEPQTEGNEWLKIGEEVRLVLSPDVLEGNTKKQVFYTVVNDNGSVSSGFYEYGACVNSDEFGEGMECKGAFYVTDVSHSYLLKAFPEAEEDKDLPLRQENASLNPDDKIIQEDDNNNFKDIINEEATSNSDNDIANDTIEFQEGPSEEPSENIPDNLLEEKLEEINEILEQKVEISTENTSSQPVEIKNSLDLESIPLKSPNTGELTEENIEAKSQELIILIVVSLIFISWWIIPINKKKKQ